MKIYLIALLLPLLATAEVFQWRDSNGRSQYSDQPHPGAQAIEINPGYSYYTAKYVYDGDTVLLHNGKKIRLLGINAPEVEGRNKPAEAGGAEAKQGLTSLLSGQQIRLQMDAEKKDKYGRTLAHILTKDGLHVNVAMVKLGLATVSIYPPNIKFTDALLAAQHHAEKNQLGIWQLPDYQAIPVASVSTNKAKGWKRLLGSVNQIQRKRKYTHLVFSEQFDARIDNRSLDLFPDMSEYLGKTIEIRGWPTRRKDHYSLFIRHPSAIRIIQ